MRPKLDENLGKDAAQALRLAGHDVATVASQTPYGAADRSLIQTGRREGRCMVTLDLEFGNPLLFRPSQYSGIVVLRLPHRPAPQDILDLVQTLIGWLPQEEQIAGKLWIVQRGRVREYEGEDID